MSRVEWGKNHNVIKIKGGGTWGNQSKGEDRADERP